MLLQHTRAWGAAGIHCPHLNKVGPFTSTAAHCTGPDIISFHVFQSRGHQQEAVAAAAACVISMECSEAGKSTWGRDKFSNMHSVETVLFFSSFHPSQETEITNPERKPIILHSSPCTKRACGRCMDSIWACSLCPSSLRQLIPETQRCLITENATVRSNWGPQRQPRYSGSAR